MMKPWRLRLLILTAAFVCCSLTPWAANDVVLSATPSAGDAPLAVDLTGSATLDLNITEYGWGYETEGVISATSAITPATMVSGVTSSHTYSTPGDYVATFQVTNASATPYSATQSIAVYTYTPTPTATNTPTPTPTTAIAFTISPSTGGVPLAASLTGAATSNAALVNYYFGYESELSANVSGSISSATTTSATSAYTYQTAGDYVASYWVVDENGIVTSATSAVSAYTPTPVDTPTPTGTPTPTNTPTATWTATPTPTRSAGVVTDLSRDVAAGIQKISFDWVANATGEATQTTSEGYSGALVRAVFKNINSTTDTAYAVTVTDSDDVDLLTGYGASIAAATTTVTHFTPEAATGVNTVILNTPLRLNISGTDSGKRGEVILYLEAQE